MRAVIATAPGRLVVDDVADPAPGHGAVVRVDRAGICGTDVKILHGDIAVRHPRVMGHEMIGVIESPAPEGTLPAGTRVMVNPGIFCGTCDLCRRDLPHLCRRGGLLGRDLDGVFAEHVAIEERFLHVVPESVSDEASGLLQVLGTVIHAQRSVDVFPDDVAVVVGLGVSGLLHLETLLARGVSRVIGVTRSRWKLDLAQELGALAVAGPDEAAGLVDEVTGGRGADVVVEAVGKEATLVQSIELAGHGADVVVFGTLTGGDTGLPYYQLYFKELTIHNPRAATPGDYDAGIGLAASGRLRLEPLVTAHFPLEGAESAFAATTTGDHLKVLLDL